MVSTKSLVYERKGEKDGFAQRFGKEIPDGTLIFMGQVKAFLVRDFVLAY